MSAINQFIEQRYSNWLDYAEYQSKRKGIPDQAMDVLNEVIADLLKKDEKRLVRMIYKASKCGKYKELDIYVLRMIRLNIFSPTSPYQSRYKSIPCDVEIDLSKLRIVDELSTLEDKPAELLDKFHQVEEAFEALNLSIKAKDIFEHRFFHGLPFTKWEGEETKKELYEIYNKVVELIKEKINGGSLL